MIDHLFTAADEAAALALMGGTGFVVVDDAGQPAWNRACVFPGLRLVTQEAVWDRTDPDNPALVTPEALYPGYWWCISINGDTPDPSLTALPAHMMAASRELGAAGWSFIFAAGLRATISGMASVRRMDGLPLGSAYPFNSPAFIA